MVDEGLDGNAGSFETRLTAHPVRIEPDDFVKPEFLLLSHAARVLEIGQGRKQVAQASRLTSGPLQPLEGGRGRAWSVTPRRARFAAHRPALQHEADALISTPS